MANYAKTALKARSAATAFRENSAKLMEGKDKAEEKYFVATEKGNVAKIMARCFEETEGRLRKAFDDKSCTGLWTSIAAMIENGFVDYLHLEDSEARSHTGRGTVRLRSASYEGNDIQDGRCKTRVVGSYKDAEGVAAQARISAYPRGLCKKLSRLKSMSQEGCAATTTSRNKNKCRKSSKAEEEGLTREEMPRTYDAYFLNVNVDVLCARQRAPEIDCGGKFGHMGSIDDHISY